MSASRTHRDRLVVVLCPPDRKQVGYRLPTPVALLRLAHPLGWVITTE
jgi:hypothetical protein